MNAVPVAARGRLNDKAFNLLNSALMLFVLFATLYPFYYCIVLSFNDGRDAMKGFIFLFPREFTLDNYKTALSDNLVLNSFAVTTLRTLAGTLASVFFNAMVAYALTKKELKLRKIYISIGLFSMYFSGGMIPTYLLIKQLGMIDKFAVYIIPTLSYFFNILIYMAFFRDIPASLVESAKIDGANEFYIFIRIIIPVSTAVIATIALFYGVYHWNSWYEPYIYVSNPKLQTLPALLVKMINQSLAEELVRNSGRSAMSFNFGIPSNSVRLATMVIATAPIMAVYPFLQKYFVKGIMIGSVKG